MTTAMVALNSNMDIMLESEGRVVTTEREILMAGYLHDLGLTKHEMAELCGVTIRTIHRWDAGDSVIPLAFIQLWDAWRRMGHAGVAWRHDAVRASLVYKGDLLND